MVEVAIHTVPSCPNEFIVETNIPGVGVQEEQLLAFPFPKVSLTLTHLAEDD